MAEPTNRTAAQFRAAVAALGSEGPERRIEGLRALEHLAQNNPRYRQALVDPICAYLRQRFSPPSTSDANQRAHAELAVRACAQRILAAHLRPRAGADVFWPGIDLDLREAALVNFDVHDCQAARVSFVQAKFSGVTDFRAAFFAEANFTSSFFSENTNFTEIAISGECRFTETLFAARATFDAAAFGGATSFRTAKFYGAARFQESTWENIVRFDHAYFTDGPVFNKARFDRPARFDHTRYDTEALFKATRFREGVSFAHSVFKDNVTFRSASFDRPSPFQGAQFLANVDLSGADQADLTGAAAAYGIAHRRRWPAGWTTVRNREARMLTLVRTAR